MNETTRQTSISRLGDLLKGIPVAMLTTLQPRDGSLHSRPMMAQNGSFDGQLYFFSRFNSAKVDEIRAGSQVNLSYTNPNQGRFISVSGTAYIERDRQKMQELWSEVYRAWFPHGLDESDLALLRVEVTQAEVWDAASKVEGEALRF